LEELISNPPSDENAVFIFCSYMFSEDHRGEQRVNSSTGHVNCGVIQNVMGKM
jgi:hypothetical protein